MPPGRRFCTAAAAALLWVQLWGMLLRAETRREAFQLVNMGGEPPYVASRTDAGICKQKGRLAGFYRMSDQADPARRWEWYLVPLLLSAATVLSAAACIKTQSMDRFLWVWSAHLTVALPLSLPLTAAGLAALRYILYGDAKRLYSFALPQPGLRALDHASDAYVTAQLERSFRTLDYYKSILPQEEPTYD